MEIVKRNGAREPFNSDKIEAAVRKSLLDVYGGKPSELIYARSRQIADGVTNIVQEKLPNPTVEQVQDLVEQQLMAFGEFDTAKHYILYRREHAALRSQFTLTEEEAKKVREARKFFTTELQAFQYMDKYARWHPGAGRRETWDETVARVMRFFIAQVGYDALDSATWNELKDAMLQMKAMPSMRVMQMAGPALERCHVGVYNCCSPDTRFITSSGVRAFEECADGERVTVLTHLGNWKPATVKKYGRDRVYPITFARGRTQHTELFTADHRWILEDGSWTTDLSVGDRLWRTPDQLTSWSYDSAEPDEKLFWAYGFVYGDGTKVKKNGEYTYSMVRLCKNKQRFLPRFVELGFSHSFPPSQDSDPTVYTGTYLKTLPSLERDGLAKVRAFVRGWLDADGSKNTNAGPNEFAGIQITGEESIEFARRVFPVVGAYINLEKDVIGSTHLGERSGPTKFFSLMFTNGSARNMSFSVVGHGEGDWSDVWCLEVEDDTSFVLPNGIATGNCAYIELSSLKAFSELLYVLMQGTGCGFSVESEVIEQLPRIKRQKKRPATQHVIPDTTEGWCDALYVGLNAWHLGCDIVFDYSQIRPQGAVLKTKGGRASGPEPLKRLLTFVRDKVLSRQGACLTTLDAHDIACFCGDIVQVGGVRRAAEISLSDLDDMDMRRAKDQSVLFGTQDGKYTPRNTQRFMANNSAVYTSKPSAVEFMEEWLSLAKSGTGERGIFNREGVNKQLPKRRKKGRFGPNPCGEIMLRSRQFCNLSIAIARADDTVETLTNKVRLAAIFGTLQSTLTNFSYLSDEWKKNCEEERLLGVDITGQMDCQLLRPDMGYGSDTDGNSVERQELLRQLRQVAIETNAELAAKLGIKQSAAVTCVKPSGNSSVLFNCSSGLHARFAPYYIRRVRVGAYGPIAKVLKDAGVPYQPEVGQSLDSATVLVFEFPVKSPEGAVTVDQLNAIDQLDNWLVLKRYYTEHNPSCTIYIAPDEWIEVGRWVYHNWDFIGGLSFLPKDGGAYDLAPHEAISREEYERRAAATPEIDYSKMARYEREDMTTSAQEYACVAGNCET